MENKIQRLLMEIIPHRIYQHKFVQILKENLCEFKITTAFLLGYETGELKSSRLTKYVTRYFKSHGNMPGVNSFT
jgi:hypothetical protein